MFARRMEPLRRSVNGHSIFLLQHAILHRPRTGHREENEYQLNHYNWSGEESAGGNQGFQNRE
jgi:hypothetical protein